MGRFILTILLGVAVVPVAFAARDPEHPPVVPTGTTSNVGASSATSGSIPLQPEVSGDAKNAGAVNTVPTSDTLDKALPPLPPMPSGRSTVIGGLIGAVDPVQDILTLNVYGGGRHPMKIYFDQRTQFYRNGVKTPLDTMRAEERASVETVLDGQTVYALSVHMLSQTPQGSCQGQVLGYDAGTGVLTVRNSLSGTPISLHVENNTTIARSGQATFMSRGEGLSDLKAGSLVAIQFEPDNRGGGIADKVSILAVPGANFAFAGKVTYLDMRTAEIALLDPNNQNSYTIYFNPSLFPQARNVHEGSNVRVTASFDGQHYVASSMTVQ